MLQLAWRGLRMLEFLMNDRGSKPLTSVELEACRAALEQISRLLVAHAGLLPSDPTSSQGGAASSQWGASSSLGGAASSQWGASSSLGGASASQGDGCVFTEATMAQLVQVAEAFDVTLPGLGCAQLKAEWDLRQQVMGLMTQVMDLQGQLADMISEMSRELSAGFNKYYKALSVMAELDPDLALHLRPIAEQVNKLKPRRPTPLRSIDQTAE